MLFTNSEKNCKFLPKFNFYKKKTKTKQSMVMSRILDQILSCHLPQSFVKAWQINSRFCVYVDRK